jgi:hypothetical protein
MNSKALTGAAGTFYVAAELSFRGMIALPTVRNTAGADILVSNAEGTRFAQLQVKTASGNAFHWPLSKRFTEWVGRNCWYVFVRRHQGRFEAFMEKAAKVAEQTVKTTEVSLAAGHKGWADCWHITGKWTADDPKREERTARQWAEFKLEGST